MLDGTPTGVNGYLMATIDNDTLTLDYRDITDTSLRVEELRALSIPESDWWRLPGRMKRPQHIRFQVACAYWKTN